MSKKNNKNNKKKSIIPCVPDGANSTLSFLVLSNNFVSNHACCQRMSFRILKKGCFQALGLQVPLYK